MKLALFFLLLAIVSLLGAGYYVFASVFINNGTVPLPDERRYSDGEYPSRYAGYHAAVRRSRRAPFQGQNEINTKKRRAFKGTGVFPAAAPGRAGNSGRDRQARIKDARASVSRLMFSAEATVSFAVWMYGV